MMISAIIASGLLASSPPADASSYILGIGNEACASASMPERSIERELWIMGFLSGVNAAKKTSTGKDVDVFSIFSEVERRCSGAPSETLMQIALDVWWAMQPKSNT